MGQTANVSREQRMRFGRFGGFEGVFLRAGAVDGRGRHAGVVEARSKRTLAHSSDPQGLDTCYLLWKWNSQNYETLSVKVSPMAAIISLSISGRIFILRKSHSLGLLFKLIIYSFYIRFSE